MRAVFAQATVAAADVVLRAGDPWDPRDPFVAAHPDLFGPEPPAASIRRTVALAELEAAPVRSRRRLL